MRAKNLAVISVFTATIVGSDFALANIPNVKLLDTLVFVSSFVFGLGVGISVAVLSELIWSFVSPYGMAGLITPFLVLGEILYALAGYSASKFWDGKVSFGSSYSLPIGALLAICAFLWDFETNVGTALIASWPSTTIKDIIAWQLSGVWFSVVHELSDFFLGAIVAPAIITVIRRRQVV